ncbi:ATP synthase subunit delta, mitochondrial, partial [Ophiophagus hannah]
MGTTVPKQHRLMSELQWLLVNFPMHHGKGGGALPEPTYHAAGGRPASRHASRQTLFLPPPTAGLLGVVGQAWLPVDLSASPQLCPWLRHVPRRSFSLPRFGLGVPVPVPSLCRSGGSCYGPRTAGLHLRLALSVSSGSLTVNADSSVQLLAEEVALLDQLDAATAKSNLDKALSELTSATDEVAKAEAQINVEANEAIVKALEKFHHCCFRSGFLKFWTSPHPSLSSFGLYRICE